MIDPERKGPRRRSLRARDAFAAAALAVWTIVILETFRTPPPAPPAVPYATAGR